MGWLSRRRHRLGFGVHSPFAYRVVKEIIAPGRKYRYYAEKAIAAHDSPSRHLTRLALVVHRLAGRFSYKVKYDALPASVEALMRYAAEPVSCNLLDDAPVLLITSKSLEADTLTRACRENVSMLILSKYEAVDTPKTGVLCIDTDAILYIPYDKTAFVAYDIRF